jgi:tol-pal system-associated acyl-CoA thioesterase
MPTPLAVKVYYEDTDSLGVVYYANYLRYFERGRSETLGELGRSVAEWNAAGYLFAVYRVEVTYHRPARLGDECLVHTRIERGTRYRLKMRQRLTRGEELLTEALVQLVCVDRDFELREFPPELLGAAE